MKPRFSVSEVAAVLGLNKYKPKHEVLLKVLSGMPQFKDVILQVKDRLNAKTDREIVECISPDVRKVLDTCVESAIVAKSDKEVTEIITTFKTERTKSMLKEALEGTRTLDIKLDDSLARIHTGQTSVEQEVERMCIRKEVKEVIEKTREHQVLTSEIQKRRGTKLESTAEDAYSVATGHTVGERNTFVRLECPEYLLIGYIDGSHDGRILETKNRKRYWKEPPAYDLIQLRCYMKMKGCIPGTLLENFPEHTPRTTHIEWDDSEWEKIHTGLVHVAKEISEMTEEEAIDLARFVFTR